jgi:hypothetical protein
MFTPHVKKGDTSKPWPTLPVTSNGEADGTTGKTSRNT